MRRTGGMSSRQSFGGLSPYFSVPQIQVLSAVVLGVNGAEGFNKLNHYGNLVQRGFLATSYSPGFIEKLQIL